MKWSYNSDGLDSNNFEIMLILFTGGASLYDSLHFIFAHHCRSMYVNRYSRAHKLINSFHFRKNNSIN